MNILDIDLDFFLNSRVENPNDNERANDDIYQPWSIDEFLNFITNKLKIKKNSPGGIFINHHEVFFKWMEMIKLNKLEIPFNLTHIDAHADLGLGESIWVDLLTEIVLLDLDKRVTVNKNISEGNFLSFAIACQWISQLNFIINENWHDDILRIILSHSSLKKIEQLSINSCLPYGNYNFEIELMKLEKTDICSGEERYNKRIKVNEPIIPFNIITYDKADSIVKDWDYIFFTQSPKYTPQSADVLLKEIKKYITNEI